MKITQSIILILIALGLACGGSSKKVEPKYEKFENEELDEYSAFRAYDHFVKGDLYEQSGNLEAAIKEYNNALIYDPGSSDIRRHLSTVYLHQHRFNEAALLRSEIAEKEVEDYNFIGMCLRQNNDFSGAIEFFERSLELDSTQYLTRKYLAALKRVLGDYEGAEREYKMSVNFAENKVESMLELGEFYSELSRFDDALNIYKQAHAEEPDNVGVSSHIAATYIAKGDTSMADSVYSGIAMENWDKPDVLQSLVSVFLALDNARFAEKSAARIAELSPDEYTAQKHYGLILYSVEKYAEAESVFTVLVKDNDDSDLYYYLGRINRFDEQYSEAEKYFAEAIALNDTLVDAWVNMAVCVDLQGRYIDALSMMNEAFGKLPDDSTTIMFYTSVIHSNNEKYELASKGYERLLESFPENIQFNFNLAAAYERMGESDNAEKYFRSILKVDPDNSLTLNYLGYMYADLVIKLDEVMGMIEKALEIQPNNGAFLDSFAWVLYKLGRYEEAIVKMNMALEFEESDSILFDHQGDIYKALNQAEKARESWEKALDLDPDNEDIRRKLNSQ